MCLLLFENAVTTQVIRPTVPPRPTPGQGASTSAVEIDEGAGRVPRP